MKTAKEWSMELFSNRKCKHNSPYQSIAYECRGCRLELFSECQKDALEAAAEIAFNRYADPAWDGFYKNAGFTIGTEIKKLSETVK